MQQPIFEFMFFAVLDLSTANMNIKLVLGFLIIALIVVAFFFGGGGPPGGSPSDSGAEDPQVTLLIYIKIIVF